MRTWMIVAVLFTLPAFAAVKFTLQSKDLKPNGTLAEKYVYSGMGCTGENLSPQLSWSNPPAGAKSFAVSVYDPDAPTGSGWWHWVIYNIPAAITELAEGAGSGKSPLPAGAVEGKTDFGKSGYGGACPPPGDKPHRYIFTITALKVDKLDVPADATAAYVGFMTHANSLGTATFTVKYSRAK